MQKPEGIDIQINAKEALKPKIKNVQKNTQLQISKLDARIAKMKGRDGYLFIKVVDLMKSHDTAYSKIFKTIFAR
jgi:hypothetical protein